VTPLSPQNPSQAVLIYQAQEVGFDSVGLRLIPVTPQEPQYDLSEGSELFNKVIKALDRTGLYVKDAEFILLDGTDQRDQWMTALERAALFGARTLTVAEIGRASCRGGV